MGWTFTHREKGTSNLDWFRREFDGSSGELLDMATKGMTAYGAYKTKTGEVIGLVILTRWVRGDYYNFGYKDMEESMGPCDDDCPKRIFDLLTPLPEADADPEVETNWAAQWRRRVQARLDRPKVKVGDLVCFDPYLTQEWGWLKYVGGRSRNLFLTKGGSRVRVRAWRNIPYKLEAA